MEPAGEAVALTGVVDCCETILAHEREAAVCAAVGALAVPWLVLTEDTVEDDAVCCC